MREVRARPTRQRDAYPSPGEAEPAVRVRFETAQQESAHPKRSPGAVAALQNGPKNGDLGGVVGDDGPRVGHQHRKEVRVVVVNVVHDKDGARLIEALDVLDAQHNAQDAAQKLRGECAAEGSRKERNREEHRSEQHHADDHQDDALGELGNTRVNLLSRTRLASRERRALSRLSIFYRRARAYS